MLQAVHEVDGGKRRSDGHVIRYGWEHALNRPDAPAILPPGPVKSPGTQLDGGMAVEGLLARGWTNQMLSALSEPNQLEAMSPDMVRRIQIEFLSTLASLPGPIRSRWYREVLGPMLRS